MLPDYLLFLADRIEDVKSRVPLVVKYLKQIDPSFDLLKSYLKTARVMSRIFNSNPELGEMIFGDTIRVSLDMIEELNMKSLKEITTLLKPIEFEPMPTVKFVKTKIPNTANLRRSQYIQRDAKPIYNLYKFLMKKSSGDKITYVQKAFDYVLNDINYGLSPDQSALGTLFYRRGACYGKINLFASLCRQAGIQTRVKLIPFRLTQGFEELFPMFIPEGFDFVQSLVNKIVGMTMPHQFLEINLDGLWIDANPIQPAKMYDLLGIPSPSIERMIEKKKNKEKKKHHVQPIYMHEIYSFYDVGGGVLGRTYFAALVNEKIDSFL